MDGKARSVAAAQQKGSQPSSSDVQVVHDAALLSFLFGHLPPFRVGCILEMHPPGFLGPCTNKDCTNKARCKGNRIFETEGGFNMHLPHHKEEKQSGYYKAMPFLLPQSMVPLLQYYLEKARPLLLDKV